MRVPVQFFSQLKDVMQTSEIEVAQKDGATITDLLAELYQRTPRLRDWDGSILIGAGVEFVGRDYVIQPGDQIAIMPPVQGG
ncbi:MAG: MoaD/ThiS family protein [Chthoniobacterales bacterium]